MKKIISGILGIFLSMIIVATSAVALFSSTLPANNVAFSTGNANLLFSRDGETWYNSYTFDGNLFENVYPGYSGYVEFWVKNGSSSPISLSISSTMTGYSGDWDALKNILAVAFIPTNGVGGTNLFYLSDWYQADPQDWGVILEAGDREYMRMYLSVPEVYPTEANSFADKWLSTNWEIYGEQVD